MKSFAWLMGIALVLGFIVKFIWWILGAAALIVLFILVLDVVDDTRARREALARHYAKIAERADVQHRWILKGDERGTYGRYPPADLRRAA
jgi:bacteriorhodopsin